MMFILLTYFWHTVGELCLSPTGLSYVTKAAPVQFVSLLMGIWFISSFIANLGGGLIAAKVEGIEKGEIKLPWHFGGGAGGLLLPVRGDLVRRGGVDAFVDAVHEAADARLRTTEPVAPLVRRSPRMSGRGGCAAW